jgi:hypothetical protein
MTDQQPARLGLVVEGSLVEGLKVRLDERANIEDVRVGHFVRIQGTKQDFFCLVEDVRLSTSAPEVLASPPDPESQGFLRSVLSGTAAFGGLDIQPMLMLDRENPDEGPLPVRTVPSHFSPVFQANEGDFESVFGADAEHRFHIGSPRDMDAEVRLDLKRFVERSNGVFGKSGTGKSFLTRILLCGVVKSNTAVNLVFDMHSEYGFQSQSENDGKIVKGLKPLFGNRVAVYTLDMDSARRRNVMPEREIKIGLNEIEIEDIALLQDELQLNPTAVESANICAEHSGRGWIRALVDADRDPKSLEETFGANGQSLAALRRKLISHIRPLKFVQDEVGERDSGLDQLMADLESGRHVVLEFGQHRSLLAYMLAANVITRRIYNRWTTQVEKYLHSQGSVPKPPQLMITIEEAHRFLDERGARQTIFGTIARELRKYQVTLLVVDQRPSGIDDEVLSQLGTRVVCALNDEKDIQAVLAGVSGASHLRSILAKLDTRQEAMLMGHALPMPIPIRTRSYDEEFYKAVSIWGGDPLEHAALGRRQYEDLFPDE